MEALAAGLGDEVLVFQVVVAVRVAQHRLDRDHHARAPGRCGCPGGPRARRCCAGRGRTVQIASRGGRAGARRAQNAANTSEQRAPGRIASAIARLHSQAMRYHSPHDSGRRAEVPDPVDVGGVPPVAGAAQPARELIADLEDALGDRRVVAARIAGLGVADVPGSRPAGRRTRRRTARGSARRAARGTGARSGQAGGRAAPARGSRRPAAQARRSRSISSGVWTLISRLMTGRAVDEGGARAATHVAEEVVDGDAERHVVAKLEPEAGACQPKLLEDAGHLADVPDLGPGPGRPLDDRPDLADPDRAPDRVEVLVVGGGGVEVVAVGGQDVPGRARLDLVVPGMGLQAGW